jgi:transcriptional regulator with XRE-family HTH domain
MIIHPHTEFIITELTNLRVELGLTQNALAKRLDMAPNALRNWEIGVTCPGFDNVVLWAEALGYEFDLHPMQNRRARHV